MTTSAFRLPAAPAAPARRIAATSALILAALLVGLGLSAAPLVQADARAAVREVEEALAAKDAARLARAVKAIGASEADKDTARVLLAVAPAGRELGVHDAALEALVLQEGSEEALAYLVRQTRSNRDWTARYILVEALARMKAGTAREALFEAFSDKHVVVAARAIEGAALAREADAIPQIITKLEQLDRRPKGLERVQEACLRALEKLTGERLATGFDWAAWWKVNEGRFDPKTVKEDGKGGDERTHTVMRRIAERGDKQFLEELAKGDIYCVTGDYDHVERVLEHLGLPHTVIERDKLAEELPTIPPTAVLVFNCHNHETALTEAETKQLAGFIAAGGYVFTSDWELQNIVVKATPGYVAVGNTTSEHELPIRPGREAAGHPYLRDVFPESPYELAAFKWKIDGMSYAVKPTSPKVITLVECPELESLYGSGIVACTFRHGRGAVLHVLSHFEKQQDPKGDGFALQQLFANFVVEKQKFRRMEMDRRRRK